MKRAPMKRIAILSFLALALAGLGWGTYQAASPRVPLSKYMPAGPLLYLDAKDFSSLLDDWNDSPQKRQWVRSDNYEVFSRSRLFLRLKGAGDQFATAAGLPPSMDFLAQVAGRNSALAIYDIGKLQFLYITELPSARSMRTALWQTRAKFEPRNAGGVDFYVRKDSESQREVAFAVSGDYLLLATREDLMAGALHLMAGTQGHTVETESWWTQSTAAAGESGDLRMVLDMQNLVPNGYFRTYWAQQNITELSQYSAAISDLFRSSKEYREDRVLIRKKESAVSAEGMAAVADLSRLVPDDAGVFVASANPTPDACFALLETKLLAPHIGPAPAAQISPQVQLTSGEQGSSSDLETRIDEPPSLNAGSTQAGAELKRLLERNSATASLQIQSSQKGQAGVFIRMHSLIVLSAASDWNTAEVHSALAEFVQPSLTAANLGFGWMQKNGYEQLNGLWPLTIAVRGKYLVASDDAALVEQVIPNFNRKSDRKPLELFAGFQHGRERTNFVRFASLVDRPGSAAPSGSASGREPEFFSGNMASLSATFADVSSEKIEVRSEGSRVMQSITYDWSR